MPRYLKYYYKNIQYVYLNFTLMWTRVRIIFFHYLVCVFDDDDDVYFYGFSSRYTFVFLIIIISNVPIYVEYNVV